MIASKTDSPLPDDLERLARKRAGMRMGWFVHLFVYVSVNLLLAIVSAASGKAWAAFPLVGWGLGLAIHGAVVLLRTGSFSLQERLVRKERARLLSQQALNPQVRP